VTTVVLVRHGLTAMTGPVLAGWTPGLHLDDRGVAQAAAVASGWRRSRSTPSSRARSTAASTPQAAVLQAQAAQGRALELQVEDRLGECRYGDWTGRPLKELAKDPLWKVVQSHPSAVVFPGPEGEALRDTQARAVGAVRDWNARLGPDATWLACSHGDVIKAVVADAMGLHLDQFQRIVIDPCSVTVVRYTELRPVRRARQRHRRQHGRPRAAQAQGAPAPDELVRRRGRRRRRGALARRARPRRVLSR
jgi:probable phosphomutase (TIGR03848 family)